MTIFSQDQLNQIVKTTLINIPDSHNNAIVGTADQTGAQVVIGFKKVTNSGEWSATGAFRHDWSGNNEVGASLMYSW